MKILLVGFKVFHPDGLTDLTKLTFDFCKCKITEPDLKLHHV